METVGQYLFVLCAGPLSRSALYHQLPHLRRPRRRDHPLHLSARPRVVLVSPAEAHRGLDAQMLRLGHRRFRLALVFPHCLHRPNRARRRSLPQERRGPSLCLLLRRQEDAAGRGRELPSSKYLCSTGSIEISVSRSNERKTPLSSRRTQPVNGRIVDADGDGDLPDGFSLIDEPAYQISHKRRVSFGREIPMEAHVQPVYAALDVSVSCGKRQRPQL